MLVDAIVDHINGRSIDQSHTAEYEERRRYCFLERVSKRTGR